MNPKEWSYNTLTISCVNNEYGHEAQLCELMEELEDMDDMSPLTFYAHVPIPDILIETYDYKSPEWKEENKRICGYQTVHEFTMKEWGCIMDAVEASVIQPDTHTLVYEFKTRANPPIAWMKSLSFQYPNMMFEIECINEMELWDEYEAVYISGKEVVHHFKKQQRE